MIQSDVLPTYIRYVIVTYIMVLSVIIFGPKKIPEIARGLGEGVRAMKKATEDIKRDIMTPVDDINPVKDIQNTIEESKKEILDSTREIEDSLDDISGPVKRN